MAPEMIVMLNQPHAQREGYSNMVDWWSLGVSMFKMLVGYRPFSDKIFEDMVELSEKMERHFKQHQNFPIYSKLFQKLDYPEFVSEHAQDLMTTLMNVNPEKRLGCKPHGVAAIKSHSFFEGIDWELLENKRLKPPSIPNSGEDYSEVEKENNHSVDFIEFMESTSKNSWLYQRPAFELQEHFAAWYVLIFERCAMCM
jgi:serine/threonine protein kinase